MNNVIKISYVYLENDEVSLNPILESFEKEIGGERHPYGMRMGAIDLVTFIEFVITFIAGASLGEILKNYLSGLVAADSAKGLGEKHREIIKNWLNNVEQGFNQLIKTVKQKFDGGFRAPTFEDKEQPIAICIHISDIEIFIILNQHNITDEAFGLLPNAIVRTLSFIAENGLPEDTFVLQLYFDSQKNDWCYLFAPSKNAFGHYIDRIININTGEITIIKSAKEFIAFTEISESDGIKFLVDPFRYD